MASIEDIKNTRLKKLEKLKEKKINPYPSKVPRDIELYKLIKDFENLEQSRKTISIAGRVMIIRGQGSILFAIIFDGTEKIQVIIKKDHIGEETFNFFNEVVDMGDFVSFTGVAIMSKTGERSLLADSWVMASKSLLPLPEKWAGLQDIEERYRKRYLDFLVNDDLRDVMLRKAKFWNVVRNFMNQEGFLEVETPTLETTTGGAEATPFTTHHNDFDLNLYLRISVGELWQKRMMAGGFPKTFEIGRVYRNEGTSPEHAQEFTNMEFYWSFANFEDGMNLVKELYIKIAREVFGKTEFQSKGHTFDLESEWKLIDYCEEVKKQTGINIETASLEDMVKKAEELGLKYEGNNKERLIDTLWKYCRKNISGPAFLVNHPKIVAPLAKILSDEKVQMFQPIIAGSEVGRGYSELNDPIDQKERFKEQQKLIDSGDTEAMMPDWEFVEMLEHGMPPTCGFGFGERLFSILEDKPLREIQSFPLMRPK